jgi:hypothetical protein
LEVLASMVFSLKFYLFIVCRKIIVCWPCILQFCCNGLQFPRGYFCWFFSDFLNLNNRVICKHDSFQVLNQPCMPASSPTWSWYIFLFIHYWIQFVKIVLKIFASMFHDRYWLIVFYSCVVFGFSIKVIMTL